MWLWLGSLISLKIVVIKKSKKLTFISSIIILILCRNRKTKNLWTHIFIFFVSWRVTGKQSHVSTTPSTPRTTPSKNKDFNNFYKNFGFHIYKIIHTNPFLQYSAGLIYIIFLQWLSWVKGFVESMRWSATEQRRLRLLYLIYY